MIYVYFSYYFYGTYSTLFVDNRKKDTGMLIFHHILVLTCLLNMQFARMHRIAAVSIIIHDFNDIFLELGKFFLIYRVRNGKNDPFYSTLSQIFLRLLAITWFITRIYLYPYMTVKNAKTSPKYLFVCFIGYQAFLIYILNLIWFTVSHNCLDQNLIYSNFQWIAINFMSVMMGRTSEVKDFTAKEDKKRK